MTNKYSYKFTELSKQDINKALSYLSNDLKNPLSSRNLYLAINGAIERICCFPYAFPDCSYFAITDKNIRHIQVGNYILIYKVINKENTLIILRFCHSMMNNNNINLLILS